MSERTKTAVKATGAKTEKASPQGRQSESGSSCTTPYECVLDLQRTIGNQAVQRLFKAGVIQTKLRIGQPNDTYEQEADRVADRVMRMPDAAINRQPSVSPSQTLQAKVFAEPSPVGVLQRQGAVQEKTTLEKLDEELNEYWPDDEDILSLLGQLSSPEKETVRKGYRDKLVKQLDDEGMCSR